MKYFLSTILIFISFSIEAQQSEFELIEKLWNGILEAEKIDEKLTRNHRFGKYIGSRFNSTVDFENKKFTKKYDLNNLVQFSELWSSDSTLRITSWFFPLDEEHLQYNLQLEIIAPMKTRKNINVLYKSHEYCYNYINKYCGRNSKNYCKEDSLLFIQDGYFYYDMIETKNQFDTFYTLIGWSKEGFTSQKKVMTSFKIKELDSMLCIIPTKIIETNEGLASHSRIFEYSAQTTMKLKYSAEQEWIVMDHLSPPTSQYDEVYEYYGPDFSFDAYVWDKNRWKLEEDVDVEKGVKKKSSEFDVEDQILEEEDIYSPK